MKTRLRLKATVRKQFILEAAALLAHEDSYKTVTQGAIAKASGVSRGIINYHFEDMDNFRRELMEFAIKEGDLIILGQGIALGDPIALAAPATAKANAIARMSNA